MFRMELDSGKSGGHVVVALRGELDLTDAANVTAALGAVTALEPRIIVDLSGLEFIDAAGVAALSRGRRQARDAGGDLLLAAPQCRVQRVLALIWDADGPGIHASAAEAAASAGASRQVIAPTRRRPAKIPAPPGTATAPRRGGRGSPPPRWRWATPRSTPSRCGCATRSSGRRNPFKIVPDGPAPAVVVATALVDVATIGILQERAVRHQEVVTGQLQVALNSRVIIEQAEGVLAERLRVTPDEAFVILRRYARDHNHPLTELSGDVIRGMARIAGDR